MIINDMDINSRFLVFDVSTGRVIFKYTDPSVPGDIPPDVSLLPVIRAEAQDNVLHIFTRTS